MQISFVKNLTDQQKFASRIQSVSSCSDSLETFVYPGGGGVSKEICVVQSACQYDVTSCVSTFKMARKVFIEETDKNFVSITETLFRFLGFGDFKVPIVIEN